MVGRYWGSFVKYIILTFLLILLSLIGVKGGRWYTEEKDKCDHGLNM